MYKLHKVFTEMHWKFVILMQTEACGVNSLLNIIFSVRHTENGGSRIYILTTDHSLLKCIGFQKSLL